MRPNFIAPNDDPTNALHLLQRLARALEYPALNLIVA